MKKILGLILLCFFTVELFSSEPILVQEDNKLTNIKSTLNNEFDLNLSNEEKEYLKNKKVLKVSNLANLPPFNFNENNIPKGYSVDYLKLMEKYLGTKIEFVSKNSWIQFLDMLKNNEIDIIPHLAITDERKKYYEFTNFSHIEYVTGIVVNKNSNIKSINDLNDKIIAVTKKSFIHTYLKNKFPNQSLYLASSTSEALNAVLLGQADVAVGSLPILNYIIQKEWLSNVKTIFLADIGLERKTALHMAVSKDNLLLKSILEKVNLIIPHNEVVRLKQKWMNLSDVGNNLTNEELIYLKNKKVIKICVLPNWLPFEQIDASGKHKGMGADFMDIISKHINTPIKLVPTKEWKDSLENIKDRKCDVLPVAMDIPGRRDIMNFTKPYISEPFVIATKVSKLFVKDTLSLSNKKIGIVKGYAFEDVLKEKNPLIKIVNVSDTKEGLEKVRNGELFGYVDTMPTIGYAIQRYSFFDLKIAGKLEFDVNLSIASRNDESLLNTIMQKALDSIPAEKRRTIVEKWIEIKVAQEFDYTLLWQISILFLLIVLIVLYKNRMVVHLNKSLIESKHETDERQEMIDKYVLILTTDIHGIITSVSDAYCKHTGYTKDELIGKDNSITNHPDMGDEFFNELWETIKNNKIWCGEVKNIRKDGSVLWLNMYIEPIMKNNTKIGYRSISEDITNKKRIEELSITDKLTELYNRMKLDEVMLVRIEEYKRYNTQFSIILADIDDFKSVNDTYGHDVGDHVLKVIAKTLKDNIRLTDVVGRWGGEEFLIICKHTDLEEAKIAAEKIRKKIEDIKFDNIGQKTISVGVSQYLEDDTVKTIFKRVDDALYLAKNSGKNIVVTL